MLDLRLKLIAVLLPAAFSWPATAQVVYQGPGAYSTYGNVTYGPKGSQLTYGNQTFTQSGSYTKHGNQLFGPSGTLLSSQANAPTASSNKALTVPSQGMTSSQPITGPRVISPGMTSSQSMMTPSASTQTYVAGPNGQSGACTTSGNQTYCN